MATPLLEPHCLGGASVLASKQARLAAEAATTAAPRRGVPLMARTAVDPALVAAYRVEAKAKTQAMQDYATRVDALREKLRVVRPAPGDPYGMPAVHISADARATAEEVDAFLHAAMPDKGKFAEALNRRGAHACGLKPGESFSLHGHDGELMAVILRDPLPDAVVSLAWLHLHAAHERMATPWGLGCEAEPAVELERVVAALHSEAGAQGYGVVGGFHVADISARSGKATNKPILSYHNRYGESQTFGIGGNANHPGRNPPLTPVC